jgi:hypothetical protein
LNEITIPYHLAIPSLICIIGLVVIFIYRKRLFSKNKLFWTCVTVFLVLYVCIVGGATYYDLFYQWNLNRYDLNKDGMFGVEEMTTEQEEAMRKLTNDTGRNFSFITGFLFAAIISTMVYIIGRLTLKRKDQDDTKKKEL